MIKFRGGPADRCQIEEARGQSPSRVITVLVEGGKVVPAANGEPYVFNRSSGEYRCMRDPLGVPPWYDRFPRAH